MRKTAEQRRALLEDFKTSGLTQQDWCNKNNINRYTLKEWLKQTRTLDHSHATNSLAWLDIESVAPTPSASSGFKLSVNGCTLEWQGAFDLHTFRSMLKAMKELC